MFLCSKVFGDYEDELVGAAKETHGVVRNECASESL